MADVVGRLDEGAADIVVADDPKLERDAAFRRVAHRGGHAGIRHRHDDVGVDVALARQFARRCACAPHRPACPPSPNPAGRNRCIRTRRSVRGVRPNGLMLCTPWSLMTTISPGSTSRTKSAPTMSSAQVSLASTQPPVPSSRCGPGSAGARPAGRARPSAPRWTARPANRRRSPASARRSAGPPRWNTG